MRYAAMVGPRPVQWIAARNSGYPGPLASVMWETCCAPHGPNQSPFMIDAAMRMRASSSCGELHRIRAGIVVRRASPAAVIRKSAGQGVRIALPAYAVHRWAADLARFVLPLAARCATAGRAMRTPWPALFLITAAGLA